MNEEVPLRMWIWPSWVLIDFLVYRYKLVYFFHKYQNAHYIYMKPENEKKKKKKGQEEQNLLQEQLSQASTYYTTSN